MTTQRAGAGEQALNNAPQGTVKTIVDAIASKRNVTLYRKG